jgi:hypothetical protein
MKPIPHPTTNPMVLRCATCAPTTSSSWTLWRHSDRRRCAANPGQRAAGMDLEQPGWFLFRWRLVYKCGYPKNGWFIMENPLLCFFQFLSCLLKMVSYAFSFQCFNGCFRVSNCFSNGCLMVLIWKTCGAFFLGCATSVVCVGVMPHL